MPKKDSPIIQVAITVVSLVIAGLLGWMATEVAGMHDTLIRHTDALTALVKSMTAAEMKLESVATRTEVDAKIAALRNNIDLDNKLVQKGTKGAELLRN